jgi:HlyD family secretion protein
MRPALTVQRWCLTAAVAALAGCQSDGPAPFSGYAEADLVYLGASAGGVLQELRVRRGDHVGQGDMLFQLDASFELYGRDAAAAQQSRAQAQLADVSKGRRQQEIDALGAQLAQAQAAAALSQAQLKRQQELVKQGFASPAALDELQAAQTRDQARIREAESQLSLAKAAARPDTINAARAEVNAASAQASQQAWAQAQKSRSAPMASMVYDVLFRPGEWVPPGQPVVVLLPDQGVKVRFFVPQADLAKVKVGQLVAVRCDQCPPGQARVRFVSPQAEFTPPVIYSNESRGKLVYLIEATPEGPLVQTLKPGQPLTVRWTS